MTLVFYYVPIYLLANSRARPGRIILLLELLFYFYLFIFVPLYYPPDTEDSEGEDEEASDWGTFENEPNN